MSGQPTPWKAFRYVVISCCLGLRRETESDFMDGAFIAEADGAFVPGEHPAVFFCVVLECLKEGFAVAGVASDAATDLTMSR